MRTFSFKKHVFADAVFTLKKTIHVYARIFSDGPIFSRNIFHKYNSWGLHWHDLLKVLEKKLLDLFTGHVQMVNRPVYISGSLIDLVYIKKGLVKQFFTNATVENIYFSDHDVSQSFSNLTGKHFRWSLFSVKLQSWRSASLLKKDSNTVFAFPWKLRNF